VTWARKVAAPGQVLRDSIIHGHNEARLSRASPGDKIVITEDVAENQTFSSPWPGEIAFTLGPDSPCFEGWRPAGTPGTWNRRNDVSPRFSRCLPAVASGIRNSRPVERQGSGRSIPEAGQLSNYCTLSGPTVCSQRACEPDATGLDRVLPAPVAGSGMHGAMTLAGPSRVLCDQCSGTRAHWPIMSQDRGTRPVVASSSSRRSCSTLCRISSSVPSPYSTILGSILREKSAQRR
jgi:hypothetical protein